MKIRKLTEAPDVWGLPTDDELEQEYQSRKAEIHKQRAERESSTFANAYPTALELLSVEEAGKLPKQVREYADIWWLKTRSVSIHRDAAAVVDFDGSIYRDGDSIEFNYNCVRPALTLENLDSSSLKLYKEYTIFDKKWIYIDNNRFLYNDESINYRFDKESADYVSSEIKEFLNDWLKELQSKAKTNESYAHTMLQRRNNKKLVEILDNYSVEQVFKPLIKFGINLRINKNARDSGSYILTFDTMYLRVKLQDDYIIVCEPQYGYEQAIIKTTYGALYYCLKEYNSVSFSRSSYRVNETKKEITPDTKLYGIKMSEYIEQDDPFEYASKAKSGQLK